MCMLIWYMILKHIRNFATFQLFISRHNWNWRRIMIIRCVIILNLQEFLAGNLYLLILKVPNNFIVKSQQNKKNPRLNGYLPPQYDKFGRSIYLSIIFFLKMSLEFSGNWDISFSLRQIRCLFSGMLELAKITPGKVFLNQWPDKTWYTHSWMLHSLLLTYV